MVRALLVCMTAAVALTACSKSSSSLTAPTISSDVTALLTVVVDGLGSAAAIAGISSVRFDAIAAAGERPLTVAVDYGDGTTSSESVSQHTYVSPGTYAVTLTVTDARGRRARASHQIIVRAVEGEWFPFGYNTRTHSAELRRLKVAAKWPNAHGRTGRSRGTTARFERNPGR